MVVERDAVSIGDIRGLPSTRRAEYLLSRSKKKGALICCETSEERENARREAQMDGRIAAGIMQLAGASSWQQFAYMNRFFAKRYSPSSRDVCCDRCRNTSRAFYTLTKPGEFTYDARNDHWRCHACNHVVAMYQKHQRYRLLTCPVRPVGLTRLRPPPRWSRRIAPCRCVPTMRLPTARHATTIQSPASP